MPRPARDRRLGPVYREPSRFVAGSGRQLRLGRPDRPSSLGQAALAFPSTGPDGSACLVAYAVLWIAYPAFFSSPVAWLMDSVLNSADYVGRPSGPTGGSWAYPPSHVLLLVPSLLLIVGVLGCVTGLPRRVPELTPLVAGWLLVSTQALLLPFLAVVGQSLLYDGLRQVLFACPAVAAAAGLRVAQGDHRSGPRPGGRTADASAGVVGRVARPSSRPDPALSLCLLLRRSLCDFTRRGLKNDYWRVSYRELIPQVPRGEFVGATPTCPTRVNRCVPSLRPAAPLQRAAPTAGPIRPAPSRPSTLLRRTPIGSPWKARSWRSTTADSCREATATSGNGREAALSRDPRDEQGRSL